MTHASSAAERVAKATFATSDVPKLACATQPVAAGRRSGGAETVTVDAGAASAVTVTVAAAIGEAGALGDVAATTPMPAPKGERHSEPGHKRLLIS
ncbi:hypothetical protein [Amycolatopsis sp. cmx-11-32]|uniref:hypothetical protein n=1 Tax=Amycolatopsis sp. cmx-11-32 TaxID=2785796 RepID=UPI0039E2C064